MANNQSFSSAVSWPPPPEGYRYLLDGQGNQTTILSKIDTSSVFSYTTQYVSYSELSPFLSTASSNLSVANTALSNALSITSTPLVNGAINDASTLVTSAWGKLDSISAGSTGAEATALLDNAKELLGSAVTKLNSVSDFVTGQVSGLITSAKGAINTALTAVDTGITKLVDAGKDLVTGAVDNLKSLVIPEDITGPSFKDTLNSIKDSSVFKDISASLSKVSEVAGSLPETIAGGLATAQAAISEKMASLQAKIGTELALAQASANLKAKELISEGVEVTQTALDSAAGNISIFKEGPAFLAEQAKGISTAVVGFATDFGVKIGDAAGVVKDGLETGAATAVGTKVTEFVNSIPPETIPDPLNPEGPPIPNPDYATFASAQASKMQALTNLTETLGTATSGLSAGFNSLVASADSARAGIISNLKASALMGQMSASASGLVAEVKSQTLDLTKIDALNMSKASVLSAKAAVTNDPNPSGTDVQAKVDPALKQIETNEVPKQNADDKVLKVEVYEYKRDYVNATKDFLLDAKKKAEATSLYSINLENKKAANVVKSNPFEEDWTAEEKAIVAKYNASKAAFVASPEYIAYEEALALHNREVDNYNNYVRKAWEEDLSRSTIPTEIRSRLTYQAAYEKKHGKNS